MSWTRVGGTGTVRFVKFRQHLGIDVGLGLDGRQSDRCGVVQTIPATWAPASGDTVNSWTQRAKNGFATAYCEVWYTIVTTGGSLTITGTGQSYGFLAVTEFAPAAPSRPTDRPRRGRDLYRAGCRQYHDHDPGSGDRRIRERHRRQRIYLEPERQFCPRLQPTL